MNKEQVIKNQLKEYKEHIRDHIGYKNNLIHIHIFFELIMRITKKEDFKLISILSSLGSNRDTIVNLFKDNPSLRAEAMALECLIASFLYPLYEHKDLRKIVRMSEKEIDSLEIMGSIFKGVKNILWDEATEKQKDEWFGTEKDEYIFSMFKDKDE